MRRGTTPTLTFTLPFQTSLIRVGFVTFKQRGKIVLDKALDDSGVALVDKQIQVTLTQAETLAMTTADTCKAQVRAILADGQTLASEIVEFPVCEILKDGEIG